MEEIETLADRVGILINGQLRVLGSVPRLKSKYGNGFKMTLKLKVIQKCNILIEALPTIINSLLQRLSCKIESKYSLQNIRNVGCTIFFEIQQDGSNCGSLVENSALETALVVAELLKMVKDRREEYAIADYTITDSSLGQVFMRFAKEQILNVG